MGFRLSGQGGKGHQYSRAPHSNAAWYLQSLIAGRQGMVDTDTLFRPTATTGFSVSDKENLLKLQQDAGSSPTFVTLAEAQAYIGLEVGVTQWFEISQTRVNQFSEATGDFQFIHVDSARAQTETAFGGTIAHGFLTLSLLSMLASQTGTIKIKGCNVDINYGLDKVRFLNPVKVGKRIRARFELMSAVDKSPNCYLLKHKATVEIEGETKPAMIAEWLGMAMI